MRWMSVPTLPHLNGPRARSFTCKPLQHKTCASSLSHARSLTQRPTRPSAYTVPGRAQDSHPHSLKRTRSSLTPASCPTQPSLPITPGFYHDSYTHAQKHPRMWHSSAGHRLTMQLRSTTANIRLDQTACLKTCHPIRSPKHFPPMTEKPPHKRGAAFYKTMRSFNRAWVQPSQAFDQERARREIYSAASSVAGFSALGAAAFFLG